MARRGMSPDHPYLVEKRQKRIARSLDIAEKIKRGMSYAAIGKEMGLTRERVRQLFRSTQEGVSLADLRQRYFWTPEKVALLGTASDNELAKQWGLSYAVPVSSMRRRLGILPYRRMAPRNARIGEKVPGTRLTIIGWKRTGKRGFSAICKCDCGNITIPISQSNLRRQKSCGCLFREMIARGGGWHFRGGMAI